MTAFLAWLTLIAPLGAAVVLALSPGIRKSSLGPTLAVLSVLFCAATSLIFWMGGHATETESSWRWMDFATSEKYGIELGVLVDPLSKMMLLVVGWVGSAIFFFALGYMKGDPSIGRFFAKFALFVFSMLGIVLANNFLMIFVFWELVGASSYLLIGYYVDRPSAVEAGKKAFLTNRVADFGFLLGILMIWKLTGSFHFGDIEKAVRDGALSHGDKGQLALASFLIFVGAMGKSAQMPFHVWLPDAMEGPTPVSALMHAATMVAAGVYMVIRVFFCFDPLGGKVDWGWAPGFVAMTGGITAILAATIALVQRDIKKVLAYSTLSQLGYMVMALGAGAYSIAMFHLTTHAFFKGLLFLCAGSVIHGCHHEQDMFAMGGLRKKMPITFWTFTAGMFALVGVFPLAGFWSKDLILDALHGKHLAGLLVAATLTAGLTSLYMFRAWFLTFFGEYRGHAHPHESPKVMTLPLVFLAIMSMGVGLFYYFVLPVQHTLDHWTMEELHVNPSIAIVATVVAGVGFLVAWAVYGRPGLDRAQAIRARAPGLYDLLWNKYYFDDFYIWLVRGVQQSIARVCRAFEENVVVKGLVGVPVRCTAWIADRSRGLQAGRLNFYAYVFAGGVTVLLLFLLAMGVR